MLVILVPPGPTHTPLLTPEIGTTVAVQRMDDGDEDDLTPMCDGIVVDRDVIGSKERKRKTAVWEVVRLWVLVGDSLGEYLIHGRTQQRMFAIDAATRAIEVAGDDDRVKALYLRATARANQRDLEAALADLDAVLALRPGHLGANAARERVLSSLGGTPRPQPAAASDRVKHATYGEGRIVRRLDGGKLEIEFAGGRRTLLARFVEPI